MKHSFIHIKSPGNSQQIVRPAGRGAIALLYILLVALAALAPAHALGPEPSIAYVYPAGARTGATTLVAVAGQYVRDVKLVQITGNGVTAKVIGFIGGNGPLNKIQEEDFKEYLKARSKKDAEKNPPAVPSLPDLVELRDLANRTPEQLRVLHEIFLDKNKMAKPPMDELVLVELTVQADAPAGNREIRLANAMGLTNPLVFQIGQLPELTEARPYELPDASRRIITSLPAVCNGQIMPGEVDRWQLELQKGQELTVSCQARNLIPYIADAVPGWFQAMLSLRDSSGREIAWADDWGSDPDPLLKVSAPATGTYTLEVRDSIYRGRYDFVYRLVAGDAASVARQLPQPSFLGRTFAAPSAAASTANAIATAASSVAASELTLGKPAAGFIGKPGEIDTFRFQGSAGQAVCARIKARVAGSPLDALLQLVDAKGTVLASNDDFEDKSLGLYAHHADPQLRFTLPAAGTYELRVSDSARLGGSDYRYELLIEAPRPDFAVISRRSGLQVMPGSSAALWVQVVRRDGWDGDIELFLDDTSGRADAANGKSTKGLKLSGARIPAGKDAIQITLDAGPKLDIGLYTLPLMARANISGQDTVHAVQAADLRMQAFGNTHLVPATSLQFVVLKPAAKGLRLRNAGEGTPGSEAASELVLVPGNSITIPVNLKLDAGQQVKAQLWESPAGLVLREQKTLPDGLELVLDVGEKLPAYDNLVFDFTLLTEKPGNKPSLSPLGTLPAMPFRKGP